MREYHPKEWPMLRVGPSDLAGNKLDVMRDATSLISISPLVATNVHSLLTVMLWVTKEGLHTRGSSLG
jgi:hypothetical protein